MKFSWLATAGVVGFGALITTACSSTADPGPKYPSVDSFVAARAQAECAGVSTNCTVTVDACVAKRKAFWTADAATKPGRTYTAGLAEGCIDAWKALFVNMTVQATQVDPHTAGSPADKCERVFQGAVADKDPCQTDYDCKGDLVCTTFGTLTAASTKRCASRRTVAAGQGCANPGEVCDKGYYCGSEKDVPTCVAKSALNADCGAAKPCAEDFRCDTTKCVDRTKSGQDCTNSDECVSTAPYCAPVNATKRVCAPTLQFARGAADCFDFGGS